MNLLESVRQAAEKGPISTAKMETREFLAKKTRELSTMADSIGLRLTKKSADEIARVIEKGKEVPDGQLKSLIDEIKKRVRQELEDTFVFILPEGKYEFYEPSAPLFGQEVNDNFPSAQYDLVEAGKCYALDRGTATVMHLMRALEPAFSSIAEELHITLKRDNWGDALQLFENEIAKLTDRAKKEFLSGAAVHFRFLKDAWRNHAMHARYKYTPEEADVIYRSVRAFMQHLAKQLRE